MESIYLPQFTVGENAFDAFKPEMGKYGTSVAVIHGEKAWAAAQDFVVPAIEKAGLKLTRELVYGHDATYEMWKRSFPTGRCRKRTCCLPSVEENASIR